MADELIDDAAVMLTSVIFDDLSNFDAYDRDFDDDYRVRGVRKK